LGQDQQGAFEDDGDDEPPDPDSPYERYFQVARDLAPDTTFDGQRGAPCGGLPSRGPYRPKVAMMHGAKYFPKFQEFIEAGGLGAYKNTVVMNIRINNLTDLDVMEGLCKINFFLDLAFWVRGDRRQCGQRAAVFPPRRHETMPVGCWIGSVVYWCDQTTSIMPARARVCWL
jgi:hypothetical protein